LALSDIVHEVSGGIASKMNGYKRAVVPQMRMNFILVISMISLAIWQPEFIFAGLEANVYPNSLILAGAFFGVLLHFRNVYALKGEFVALDVLQEAFDDSGTLSAPGTDRPAEAVKRKARLATPAHIFSGVRLMAQPLSLLLAQAYRQGNTRIPKSTATALVTDLHAQVIAKNSLSNYVAGLMILLGLLGTGVGLMGTVGSVGDILSLLNISASTVTAVMQALMTKPEVFLAVMATSFSSSLFGLSGWLLLGVMTKISSRADKILKRDFEAWLRRLAQREQLKEDPRLELDAATESAEEDNGAAATRALLHIARASVFSNAQLAQRLDRLVDGYAALERESERSRQVHNALSERVEQSLGAQVDLLKIVRTAYQSQEEPLTRMSATIERIEERLIREYGRAHELQAQHNRALVLQADQAAQRSALATQHLGEQTQAIRESIDHLGKTMTAAMIEALAQTSAFGTEPGASEPGDRSVLSNALGSGWGFLNEEHAETIDRRDTDRRVNKRRGHDQPERIPSQGDCRITERRVGTRRLDKVTVRETDAFEARVGGQASQNELENNKVEEEVAKWSFEINADDFEDDDELPELDVATAGKRRPIA
jgi:hypothetical protein